MRDSKEIGKLGGKSRSETKRAAARHNGAKGGRPPKIPAEGVTLEYLRKLERYRVVDGVEKCLAQSQAEGKTDLRMIFSVLSKKEIRAELIRKGRRDLWLRYLKEERKEKSHAETFDEYLERMRRYGITPPPISTREMWERHQIEMGFVKPKHPTTAETKA